MNQPHITKSYIIQNVFDTDVGQQPVIVHRITGEVRPFNYEEFLDLRENHERYSIFRDEYTDDYLRTGKMRKQTPKEQYKMHEVVWRKIGETYGP